MISRQAIEAEILRQAQARGVGKSICPSEVARALAPDEPAWRGLLSAVRSAAVALAQAGRIEVLRKGKPIDGATPVRGVIRLRIRPPETET